MKLSIYRLLILIRKKMMKREFMNSSLVYAVFATAILFTSCDDTLMQVSSSVNEDRKALDVDYTGKRITEICRERWNLEERLSEVVKGIKEKERECDRRKVQLNAAEDALSALSSRKSYMTEDEMQREKTECELSVMSAKMKYEASQRGLDNLVRERGIILSSISRLDDEEQRLR